MVHETRRSSVTHSETLAVAAEGGAKAPQLYTKGGRALQNNL